MQEMRDLKASDFDDTVHGYMYLLYLLPHILIPPCHWSQAEKIVNFMTAWTTFQVTVLLTWGFSGDPFLILFLSSLGGRGFVLLEFWMNVLLHVLECDT